MFKKRFQDLNRDRAVPAMLGALCAEEVAKPWRNSGMVVSGTGGTPVSRGSFATASRAFSAALAFVLAAIFLAGCAAQAGKSTLTFERDATKVPPLQAVEDRGLYALFAGDGITPIEAVYLNKGDKYGFQFHEGKVVGVYIKRGETKLIPLDAILASEYLWKYQGDKQP